MNKRIILRPHFIKLLLIVLLTTATRTNQTFNPSHSDEIDDPIFNSSSKNRNGLAANKAPIPSSEQAFQNFLAAYPYTFSSSQESKQRRAHFLAVDALIKAHNKKSNSKFQLGHNEFSILSPSEKSQYLGISPEAVYSHQNATQEIHQVNTESGAAALPPSVDFRPSHCLQPIKNQGQCGSCWAFATVAILEFDYCINYQKVALSEQQLVDCTPKYAGCGGGLVDSALEYVAVQGGIDTQASYPYTSGNGKYGVCKYNSNSKGASVSLANPVTYINGGDINTMMQLLANNRIFTVYITVVDSFFSYTGGVYSDSNCGGLINHAVSVVGYGNLNGIDHWIIRNSWGTGWGLSGYALIQRGVNMCNIESYAMTTTASFAFDWQSGTNGQVMWASKCDFYGSDIARQSSAGEDCGGLCIANPQCNYFSWNYGTCYLKNGKNIKPRLFDSNVPAVCGYVPNRGALPGATIDNGNANNSNQQPSNTIKPVTIAVTANPIGFDSPITCSVCPYSQINNSYYICLSVGNVNGRVSTSATLSEIQGYKYHINNNNQFSFDALGKAVFNLGSIVKINFDDDSSATFKLGDCASGQP